MSEIIVAPSILSMDFSEIKEQMKQVNESKAKWIHFDVMDGHFVPNISFGTDILKSIRKLTNKVIDVHLMISDPMFYSKKFIEAGADVITFHTEAFENNVEEIKDCLDYIHSLHCQSGIVVKPNTKIEQFEDLLPFVDVVLIMSVEPGFGGQSFMENQLVKVSWLYERRQKLQLNYRIEIDGGINNETFKLALDAGCDTLVAGSYVFKNDIVETINGLFQ